MNNNYKINTISYEGIVKIKLIDEKTKRIKKNFKFHNNGTEQLFKFLCNSLIRGNYEVGKAPLTIDVSNDYYFPNSNLTSALNYRVVVSGKLITNITEDFNVEGVGEKITLDFPYMASFSALIPSSSLVNAQKPIKCIQLYSSANISDKIDSFLAWVNIPILEDASGGTDETQGIIVKSGEALLVEWNMGFQNPYNFSTNN